MSTAEIWFYFWTIAFVVSGASFAFIAAVVLVRGVADLRALIELLRSAGRDA